jgi:hypothetical protein
VPAQTSGGTAAVAIWTPGEAVLATDSKVTLSGGGAVLPAEQSCKIRTSGRFFYAIAGLYNHAPTGFDAWRLAEGAIAGATSVNEAASRAERRIQPALEMALADIRRRDPQDYARRYAEVWLAIWIAGTERGDPVMAGREFLPGRTVAREFPGASGAGAKGEIGIAIFGERQAIDSSYGDVQAIGRSVEAKGPAAAARALVELEIAGEPEKAGGPISMARIRTVRTTTGGAEWIERGLCAGPR